MSVLKITEYENIDPEEVIANLLIKTEKSVAMSTSLFPPFFNRPKIKEAFLKALNEADNFRLLIDYNNDWEESKKQIPWLANLETETKLNVRKSPNPVLHWVMVDGRHFRLEKPHGTFPSKEVIKTSNLLIEDAIKAISDELQDTFNLWWKDAFIVK